MCPQSQESRGFVTELGYLSDLKKKADEVVGMLVCTVGGAGWGGGAGGVSECMCTTLRNPLTMLTL